MGKRVFGILMALLVAVSVINLPVEAAVKYKITYELNGGTNNANNPATYTGAKTIILKEPTRKGYSFVGWFKDQKLTKSITEIKKGSTGNKKVYAKWSPNRYTIAFNGNGATSGTMTSQTKLKYGKKYQLSANTFKKKGATFLGWNTKADGTGKAYANKETVKNLTYKNGKKVTLYAQWLRKIDQSEYKIKQNDGKDDTKKINDALREAGEIAAEKGGKVRVTLAAGTYNVTIDDNSTFAILMRSNVELRLADGAIIKVKKKSCKQCCGAICFFNVKNSTITGGKLVCGNPTSNEDIYGIWVKQSKDVTIQKMEISGAHSDGIYLSPQQLYGGGSVGNNGITISKCKIHDNARNNIGIVDADNVTIKGCNLYNTGERAPSACVCIEPNHDISGDKKCKDILIKDTTMNTGRPGDSWEYRTLHIYKRPEAPREIIAENVRVESSTLNGYYSNVSGGKNIIVSRTSVINGNNTGLVWGD